MDPKRELTSVDLRALVREFSALEGAKLDKVYLYHNKLVRLKLRDFDRGRIELLIEVGDRKRAHITAPEHVPTAPDRPPNFAMMLRNRLTGADLTGVEQFGFDRILVFRFEREDQNTTIVAEFFGQGNIAVLDETDRVVDSLETVRLKSRTVVPGSQYEFPSMRLDPLVMSADTFATTMDGSDTDIVRTLATQLNFGGLYAEELCTRAGVQKTCSIDEATDQDYERLFAAIGRLADDLNRSSFDPRIYRDEHERYVDVTPIPLVEHESLDSIPFDTFNEAIDEYFVGLDKNEEGRSVEARPDFESRIGKYRRIIEQQENAIEQFDRQAQSKREQAESLYSHYGFVDEILTTIQEARADGRSWEEIEATLEAGAANNVAPAKAILAVDGSRGYITIDVDGTPIELDTRFGVEKNADRLYTEAKTILDKKSGAQTAIQESREELASIRTQKDQWESGSTKADGDAHETTADGADVDWLTHNSIPIRKVDEWYERFRWFHTTDGFLVIGGRNADQNEELVRKYLDRGDLFFHAQAHGGPATILKATGPSEPAKEVTFPESSLAETAQFAVSYSSVWKAGQYAGDVYAVDFDQVSKTPESGEYLEKGGFAVRGERTYFDGVPVGVAIGITCEPVTRVIGGPPSAIYRHAETSIDVQPGRFAQADVAKRIYRRFRDEFSDTTFVRKVASTDRVQAFLPPGTSRIKD